MKGQIQDKKVAQPLKQIQKIEQKRQQRRVKMEEAKKQKQEKKAYNMASGKNVDIDFEIMIQKNKFRQKILSPHTSSADLKLAVCIRKRPIFKKEEQNGQIDSISCANPQIKIHQPKYRVDGITKYVENHLFTFDNTFNQEQNTSQIYQVSLKPLVPLLVSDGIVTCFAYGQTGSGKTFTMNQLQVLVVKEMYRLTGNSYQVMVSFFQIYGGRCLDLLNNKEPLNILEDQNNCIQIPGLSEKYVTSAEQLLKVMGIANSCRTTHATTANDTSSRSHAICQIIIKKNNKQTGKLLLVDLAGSQRAQDTQSNNRQRRMEGAEINKSLLALKECIRAMDEKADHVPFRASKLTLILRDSFIAKQNHSKVVIIACISPGSSSADHSLNTLRYADRLKDNSEVSKKYNDIEKNKSQSFEDRKENLREQVMQRIQSSKNISGKREDVKTPQKSGNKTPQKTEKSKTNNPIPQNKIPILPKLNNKKEQAVINLRKEQKIVEIPAFNKKIPLGNLQKAVSINPKIVEKQEEIIQQIEPEFIPKSNNKKVKDDMNAMKQTLKNYENKEEYIKFQQKVANVFEEQEEVFATHMAAIKQDAKLLTQQSQLISMIQGVGFIDYDADSYVEKLEIIIKKKLKMYALLSKRVESFKKCLKQQDQVRQNVKDTHYF